MGPSTVISVQGAFDDTAASSLCRRLAQMDSRRSVIIDFTEARELNVVALTVLVNGNGEIRPPLSLWGLSQHYQRLLQYLGLPVAHGLPRDYPSTRSERAAET